MGKTKLTAEKWMYEDVSVKSHLEYGARKFFQVDKRPHGKEAESVLLKQAKGRHKLRETEIGGRERKRVGEKWGEKPEEHSKSNKYVLKRSMMTTDTWRCLKLSRRKLIKF